MKRTVSIVLKSESPLLMNKFPLTPHPPGFDKRPAAEQAEACCYRNAEGKLCAPGVNIYRGLISAANFVKWRGKATCWRPVASSFHVTPDEIEFDTQQYEVLTLPIRNAVSGGRVLKHRPMLKTWSLAFDLSWEEALLSEAQVKEIVSNLGSLVGLFDYRPENSGPYGRCCIASWKLKKESKA
jgi:hypothetical protein